jgi:hypothetical protein
MRKRTLVAVVGPMIVLLTTGCGPVLHAAGGTGATRPALDLTANDSPRVATDIYATGLCAGLANFGLSYQDAKTTRAAAWNGTAEHARQAMLTYVGSLDSALTKAIADTRKAGVPDLPHGARISSDLLAALLTAQQANADLHAKALVLPIDNRADFDASAGPLLDRSDRDVAAALAKLTTLDDEPGFQSAFNHNRICRAL